MGGCEECAGAAWVSGLVVGILVGLTVVAGKIALEINKRRKVQ